MNRDNLNKLADYLLSLPHDYNHFGMASFIKSSTFDENLQNYALHNGGVHQCGTAACAVGHGPSAGILVPKSLIRAYGPDDVHVSWSSYTSEFFTDDPREFEWMFGGDWSRTDDHHWGAAKRIQYCLEHGVPEGFYDSTRDAERFLHLYAPEQARILLRRST